MFYHEIFEIFHATARIFNFEKNLCISCYLTRPGAGGAGADGYENVIVFAILLNFNLDTKVR